MTTDPLPDAARAARLTDALRRCGLLVDGAVGHVTVESMRPTVLSRIIRLRLAYDGAQGDAPPTIILKTGHPERAHPAWRAGQHEVAFYTDVASNMPSRLVPRCFDASWAADTNAWHLLLEDLTDSHLIATAWPLPPTAAQCEAVVAALARCHAVWWDHPRLGAGVGTWLDAEASAANVRASAEQFVRFADRLGDDLSPARRDLYQRLLDAAPRLMTRYHTRRHVTIVHGDAHVWNCLLPRDGGADGRFFDWDSWRTDCATDDLAYMMAMHWYPDRRRRLERPLLDLYHATLVAQGVRAYDRRMLDDDYRLSVLWQALTPMWQAANNIPPAIWWNNLERILLAVDDLDCRALLA